KGLGALVRIVGGEFFRLAVSRLGLLRRLGRLQPPALAILLPLPEVKRTWPILGGDQLDRRSRHNQAEEGLVRVHQEIGSSSILMIALSAVGVANIQEDEWHGFRPRTSLQQNLAALFVVTERRLGGRGRVACEAYRDRQVETVRRLLDRGSLIVSA